MTMDTFGLGYLISGIMIIITNLWFPDYYLTEILPICLIITGIFYLLVMDEPRNKIHNRKEICKDVEK